MKKLSLAHLKVSSFQTNTQKEADVVRGGSQYFCSDVKCITNVCWTGLYNTNCKEYKDKTL